MLLDVRDGACEVLGGHQSETGGKCGFYLLVPSLQSTADQLRVEKYEDGYRVLEGTPDMGVIETSEVSAPEIVAQYTVLAVSIRKKLFAFLARM